MIQTGLRALERACAFLAGLALLAIMGVVCVDVVLRYAFNAPLGWVYDLVSLYVLATVFYLSVSRTFAADEHIRIDVLVRRFGPTSSRWARRVHLACALPVFGAMAWLGAVEAVAAYQQGLVLSGPIPWPSWPTPALVAIGMTMLSVRIALVLVSGEMPPSPEHSADAPASASH